jgi:hypothetical protein
MSRVRSAALALAVAGAALSLSACSATAPTAEVALPTVVPTGTGTFDSALAYQSAWHVEAKSTYVNGSVDVCDLHLAIAIEDAAAMSDPNTRVPIYGFVARDGSLSYGTVWPTAVPGTGIVSGKGAYVMNYDASGLPTTAVGTAEVTWHDSKASPKTSVRADRIELVFTQEPRAGHCE